jgi:hypothetical protein
MFLSRRTVQTHISHILSKIGARSRVDIAREALRRGTDGVLREAHLRLRFQLRHGLRFQLDLGLRFRFIELGAEHPHQLLVGRVL